MKNYYVVLMLLFTFMFQSCETFEIENETNQVELSKIENVKTLEGESQRVAFRLLKNETKAKLWKDKIEKLLAKDVLSSNQIKMVNELKSYITKETYDTKNSRYESILDNISDWSQRAQKHFTKAEYVEYFVFISGKVMYSEDPSCDCSRQSNHCGAYWEDIDCLNKTCTDDSILGCGTLMAYDCDGLCDE